MSDDPTSRWVQLRWSPSPMMICWTVEVVGDEFTDCKGRRCRYARFVGTFWYTRRNAERYARWYSETHGIPFVERVLFPWSSLVGP